MLCKTGVVLRARCCWLRVFGVSARCGMRKPNTRASVKHNAGSQRRRAPPSHRRRQLLGLQGCHPFPRQCLLGPSSDQHWWPSRVRPLSVPFPQVIDDRRNRRAAVRLNQYLSEVSSDVQGFVAVRNHPTPEACWGGPQPVAGISSASFSQGLSQFSVSRGRPLSMRSISLRSARVYVRRSVCVLN
jgi:hypothetical protein